MSSLIQKTSSSILMLYCSTSLLACGGGGAYNETAYAAGSPEALSPIVAASATAVTGRVPAVEPPSVESSLADGATEASVAPTIKPVIAVPTEVIIEPISASDSTALPPTYLATVSTAVPVGKAAIAPVNATGEITNLTVESTSSATQSNVPVTFGQVFAEGDVMAGVPLTAVLANGSRVALQVDAKAKHPDGSLRHAVISMIVPQLVAGQPQTLSLLKYSALSKPEQHTPAALISSGFSAGVSVKIGGQLYTASADALLKAAKYTTWLSGPIVNEWLISTPLMSAQGIAHPHLSARFAIRSYSGVSKARVDVTLENDWAYEPNPQNFTYDAQISVGGKLAYEKLALTHLHHARWRKVAWWGTAPEVLVKHNSAYLIASRALPNYDQTVVTAESALVAIQTKFSGAATEPMASGMAAGYMPTTGGRNDIGLLPGWAVTYLLTMDKRAKDATLGTADLAGSWSAHYRDKVTDRPISVVNYPYMTILGRPTDAVNPLTKKSEFFPACAATTACVTPHMVDAAHQPGFAYLPYLVTGDYYYLEELQFYSMWNLFNLNPGNRAYAKGLLWANQVRAQAWSMRTLSEAAYITPDGDPLKVQFETFLANNLDWYINTYSANPAANKLGALVHQQLGDNGRSISTWMDDFFTAAVGHTVELGYTKALPLLRWKAQFPISRLTGTGVCWIGNGMQYSLLVKDSATSPFYTSIADSYRAANTAEFLKLPCAGAEMALALHLKVGEMTGYSASVNGFPSNAQPALAYSVVAKGGSEAWKVFAARSVKPNYGLGPQFAIVPR